jgi:hypothetical protein
MIDIYLSEINAIYDMKPGDVITVSRNDDVELNDICYELMYENKIAKVDPHFAYPEYIQIEMAVLPVQKQAAELLVRAHNSKSFKENEDHLVRLKIEDHTFNLQSFKAAVYLAMKKYKVPGSPFVVFRGDTIELYIKEVRFDVTPHVAELKNLSMVNITVPTGVNRDTVRTNVYRKAKEMGLSVKTSFQGKTMTVTRKQEVTGNTGEHAALRAVNYSKKFDAWLNQLPYDVPTAVPEIAGLTVNEKGHAYIAALCSRRKEGNFKVSKGVVTRRSVCLSKDKEDGRVCLTINGERVFKCKTRSVTGITGGEHAEMHLILAERGLSGREYR